MNEDQLPLYTPSTEEIEAARRVYEAKYPHDIAYRAAIQLADLAWRGETALSEADAVWILSKIGISHTTNTDPTLNKTWRITLPTSSALSMSIGTSSMTFGRDL